MRVAGRLSAKHSVTVSIDAAREPLARLGHDPLDTPQFGHACIDLPSYWRQDFI